MKRALHLCGGGPLLWLFCLFCAGCGGAAPSVGPTPSAEGEVERHFPADVGTAWSYDVVADHEARALVVARVVAREGELVAISVSGSEPNQYRLERDGVRSSDTGTYVLKWPLRVGASWPARGGGEARILDVSGSLDTPAGRLEGCVVVREERPSPPSTVDTHFCPGVGVARLEIVTSLEGHVLRTVTTLRGFARAEP